MLLGQITQNVDVVCHAAHGDEVTLEILQDARHIGPNAWANIGSEPWVSSLGGEDDVAGENMK